MANIQTFLQNILSARYGKDVRQSIHDAIEEVDRVADTAQGSATEAAVQAEQYRNETEQLRNEVAEIVPEGYADLVEQVQENTVKVDTIIEKADLGIKETASGEEIHLTDSAEGKAVEFALYGKAKQNTTSGKNLVSDDWEQGLLSVDNGTSISSNSYWIHTNKYVEVDSTKRYTISGDTTSSATIYLYDENKSFLTTLQPLRYVGTPTKTITIPEKTKYVRFGYNYSGDTETITPSQMGVLHWLQFEEGTVATEYEPYSGGIPSPNPQYPQPIEVSGASGSVAVKSCGKNLLKNEATSKTVNGITFTVNDDKSVTANGTSSSTASARLTLKSKQFISAGKYYCSGSIGGGGKYQIFCSLYDENKKYYGERYNANGQSLWDIPQDSYVDFVIDVLKDKTVDNVTFYPMLRLSTDTDSTYEPYKETLSTIPTENGLAAIKVDSNGNYTDSNGQQWICDEVVKYADGSGAYIERIKHYSLAVADMNNSEDFPGWKRTNVMDLGEVIGDGINRMYTENVMLNIGTCVNFNTLIENKTIFLSKSIYGMNQTEWKTNYPDLIVDIYVTRVTPIRTPLTAEEIAEIEKLHTFCPVTNISNDFDCEMSVMYYCDSKNYIDNKIALLTTAMVNSI